MKKIVTTLLVTTLATFALNVGEVPKEITLSDKNGALVTGEAWHSNMLKEKVSILFYVDPDKKEDSDAFMEELHKKAYDTTNFRHIAILNLKATWLPDFAIEKKLQSKQKEFPSIIYAKDKTKYLVQEWELADDASNVLLFDKEGKLIYQHDGMMENDEMQKVFALIEENLNK